MEKWRGRKRLGGQKKTPAQIYLQENVYICDRRVPRPTKNRCWFSIVRNSPVAACRLSQQSTVPSAMTVYRHLSYSDLHRFVPRELFVSLPAEWLRSLWKRKRLELFEAFLSAPSRCRSNSTANSCGIFGTRVFRNCRQRDNHTRDETGTSKPTLPRQMQHGPKCSPIFYP